MFAKHSDAALAATISICFLVLLLFKHGVGCNVDGWTLTALALAAIPWVTVIANKSRPDKWHFLLVFSLIWFVTAALYTFAITSRPDSISILLLIALSLPWCIPLLSSIRIPTRTLIGILFSATCLVITAVGIKKKLWATDSWSSGLLALAATPWIAYFVSEIEIFGAKVKTRLAEVEEVANRAAGAAASLEKTVLVEAAPATAAPDARTTAHNPEIALRKQLEDLAAQYVSTRESMSKGEARTKEMTAIVRKMMDVPADFSEDEIKQQLRSHDIGARLVAFVQLLRNPKCGCLDELVRTIPQSVNRAFGQFWGLRALQRLLQHCGSRAVTEDHLSILKNFQQSLKRDTDRYYELSKILADFERQG